MQETALNLIAIGIFSITLLSLLSPILNISPVIPAAITFGILSLTTLDTLGWQNKGSTLLLDFFSPRQHRQRVVHHEAGHFLVAYFLGIPISGYTLTAWEAFQQKQPGLGGVRFDNQALLESDNLSGQMVLILERFSTVWMAGIAAEKIIYGNVSGGAEDRLQLKEALKLAGLSLNLYEQKESWALLQATNLLKRHEKAYHTLVDAMTKRATVAECYQVLQQNSVE